MESKTLLTEANEYLARGFSIIPVGRDKKPLVEWKRFQTERPSSKQLAEWFEMYPHENLGVVTGEISGIVVIDIEAGGSTNGFPPTVVSRTGGGGWHYFYKHPGVPIKNSVKDLAPLTDVRGDGGYVVLPPSKHMSGENYEWIISPDDSEFTELPDFLLNKIVKEKQETDWREVTENNVPEGSRNETAAKIAGKILYDLDADLWEKIGWPGFLGWNKTSCKPPLSERELRSVFDSISQKEIGSKKRKLRDPRAMSHRVRNAVVARLSDIDPEPISWLWPGRIALGKLTLLSGDPGLGKSLITATLASIVSKGLAWPIEGSQAPLGTTVFLSAEDDPADTIRPRLDAAQADCSRIHVLKAIEVIDESGELTQRSFSLKNDISTLEKLLSLLDDCKLLIIDPVTAYLDGTDGNANSDIRGLLAPLSDLAARHKVAIVLVSHLNKSGGGNAIYRTMGSLAFTAAVRTAHIVAKDPDHEGRVLVMPIKNNIAKDTSGIAYSVITAENGAPLLVWETEPVTMTADEALGQVRDNDVKSETDWAVLILEDILVNGPVKAEEAYKKAKSLGITEKSVRRAREKLNVVPRKEGSFREGYWVWCLPGHEDALVMQDAPTETVGTLGDTGHLGEADTPLADTPF